MALAHPSNAMKEFADYIIEQQRIKADDDTRKRTRDEVNDGKCILCLERSLTAAFIPCGHCVCCYDCASTMESYRCPICRKPATVQRLFVG